MGKTQILKKNVTWTVFICRHRYEDGVTFLTGIHLSTAKFKCCWKTSMAPVEIYVAVAVSSCCCLPTPMALASGGSQMFPLVVHQPASPSIWPAVQSLRRGLSTNPGATMWCVCGCCVQFIINIISLILL